VFLALAGESENQGVNEQVRRDVRVDSDPRVPIVSDDVNLDSRRFVLAGVLRVRLG
jgi:hypothetical protein